MRLSRALKDKWPQYNERHDKVILQHDNARPHVAKVVKIYLETLKWEVLPHPLYSPDVAPLDYHLFQSMAHGLADQYFRSYKETYGADKDKMLGIENENADNVVAARRFVGWYNGLPEDKDLKVDLSGEKAAVLGQGNVALDIARILLTPVDELRKTDITEHALAALADSKIRELYLVGRRGPLQVSFTIKELREQIKKKNCATVWRKSDFVGVPEVLEKLPRPRKRLTELMLKSVDEAQNINSISKDMKVFKPIFFRSPKKFLLDQNKLKGIELSCNKLVGEDVVQQKCVSTEDKEILDCDLVFRSIGYKSIKVDDAIHFDDKTGLVVNDNGRVSSDKNDGLANLYVAGWLGTGPVGVILHTMGNAFQVAKAVCEDLSNGGTYNVKSGFEEIRKDLLKNNIKVVDWAGWEKIDKYEIEQGKKCGKPREKVCDIEKMIEIAT
ncbi:NADPH:adrenodoxin oxidoreductase, mitochondrial [Eumeta japonica]|uniref:NADPH:adrenodoxin oxidoreductase, mitochondrial n=1 Tax=Eumeta variegata TaxID=151549 RepID=A0A4C1TF90_EUMVA|nr:NADPH:adrenodoxin oxidoreductase, mitochondrial [Eumeta japonica]